MKKNKIALIAVAVLGLGSFAQAQDNTWLGTTAGPSPWNDGDNWSLGTQPPNNNSQRAVFNDPTGSVQPTSTGIASAGSVYFSQAGWNVMADTYVQVWGTGVESDGAGINEINNINNRSGGALTFDTGAGNLLAVGAFDSSSASAQNFIKVGAGTLALSNAHLRNVTFSEGTLLLNGGNFTDGQGVDFITPSGATLGGAGVLTLNRNSDEVTMQSGSVMNPGGDGVNTDEIGTFTVNSADLTGVKKIDFLTGSTFAVDLAAGNFSDQLRLTSDAGNARLTLETGVTLDLSGFAGPGVYDIVSIIGAGTTFDAGNVFTDVTFNGSPLVEGLDYELAYTYKGSGDMFDGGVQLTVLTAVPEPGSIGLVIGGLAVLIGMIRRRHLAAER